MGMCGSGVMMEWDCGVELWSTRFAFTISRLFGPRQDTFETLTRRASILIFEGPPGAHSTIPLNGHDYKRQVLIAKNFDLHSLQIFRVSKPLLSGEYFTLCRGLRGFRRGAERCHAI